MDDSECSMLRKNILIQEIKEGALELALKLNKLLYQPHRNVLFSPINIYTALALTHYGSDRTTRDKLAQVLGFSEDDDKILLRHEKLACILEYIENTPDIHIRNANGIFIQKDLNLAKSYESQVPCKMFDVDFENNFAQAIDNINQFISENTENKISKLFESPPSSNTRILLVSCLHFKAPWSIPFDEACTEKKNFTTISGIPLSKSIFWCNTPVNMMLRGDYVPYINLPNLQIEAIDLAYAQGEVSMYYILPYTKQSLDNVVSSLDSGTLRRIVQQSKSMRVDIKIPRMKFKSSNDINHVLQKLGIENSNLTNMFNDTVSHPLRIANATEIEISECGSEAGPLPGRHLICYPQQKPVKFYVNRPFLIFVYHRITQTILFLGTFYDPNVVE